MPSDCLHAGVTKKPFAVGAPLGDARVHVANEDRRESHNPAVMAQRSRLATEFLGAFAIGDIDKIDHESIDVVFERAASEQARPVPSPVAAANLALTVLQSTQDVLDVL